MFVRRSCNIKDLKHVFINFNFVNHLSQLAIENSTVSSNVNTIHNVRTKSLPNCTKYLSACLGLEGIALPLAQKSIQRQ